MEECKVRLLPQIHQKIHLHMEQVSQNTYRMLAEDITLLKGQKESGQDLASLGGNCKRPKAPTPSWWEERGTENIF